jgi:homoserine O-succinyltransferase
MPVYLHSDRSSRDSRGGEEGLTWPRRKPSSLPEQSSPSITIGLINNMPQAAFTATERQFISLLDAASEDIPIRLSLYSLAGIPRPEQGPESAGSIYSNIEDLLETTLDGLIVTGKEPLTPDLRDEPCWKSFTQVLDWARTNTHSAVWSCLAAHAAVLYMDGIGRRRSEHKHFGLLQCTEVSGHQLRAGAPARFAVPHSRWNGLPEEELEAHGYSVLARTADTGVDTFVKQDDSLFVFFQGHPEYESDTLLREYRRDVGRYLRQEANTYPLMPRGYFDDFTENALSALWEEGMTRPGDELFAKIESVLETARIENTWGRTAARTYRNWLEYICAQKSESKRELNASGPISMSR